MISCSKRAIQSHTQEDQECLLADSSLVLCCQFCSATLCLLEAEDFLRFTVGTIHLVTIFGVRRPIGLLISSPVPTSRSQSAHVYRHIRCGTTDDRPGWRHAQINRIEANGVDTSGGTYTFENGTIEILLTGGNALLTEDGGGSLTFESDISFGTGCTAPRFNVAPSGERILVNGNVAPAASNNAPVTLELTSRNLSFNPSVTVAGVISDGTDPSATLSLTAGYGPDSENHRGTVRVTGTNTYTGQTIVNGAVLEFDSIGNVGSGPSALGNPTPANSTIRLGAVDTSTTLVPGTLRYRGSLDGQTDRDLALQGSGGILDPQGPGSSGVEEDEEDPIIGKLLWNGNVSASQELAAPCRSMALVRLKAHTSSMASFPMALAR